MAISAVRERTGESALDACWANATACAEQIAGRVVAGRFWRFKALTAVLALTLLRAFPRLRRAGMAVRRGNLGSVQPLMEHPWADPTTLPHPADDARLRNLTFRRTPFLLARLLRLRQTGMLMVLAASGVALLYGTLAIAGSVSSRKAALYICVAAACSWAGETDFHDLRGGYFDAMALTLLILAMQAAWPSAALCVFLAAWTDERSLLASVFVVLFAALRGNGRMKLLAAPFGWVAYGATRWLLASQGSMAGTTGGVGWATLAQQANAIPLGLWSGLGGCWILIVAGIASAVLQKRYKLFAGLCAAVGLVMLAAAAITDITRTAAYAFPAVLVSVALLARGEPIESVEKLAAAAAVVSWIVPTYYVQGSQGFWWLYPLPVQVVRWMAA